MPDRPITTPTGEDRAKFVQNALDFEEKKHEDVASNDIEEYKHEVVHRKERQNIA